MAVLVSTTGTKLIVVINDLGGRQFDHPTVNFDLLSTNSNEEIQNSLDLQAALDAGYITISSNGTNIVDVSQSSISPFGTQFYKQENLTVSSTTSSSFKDKVVLTLSNLPIGEYRIGVSYGWNYNDTKNDFESKVTLDGTQIGELHKEESKDSGGNWQSTGTDQRKYIEREFFKSLGGSHEVKLQWRSSKNGDDDEDGIAASIWDSVITVWRVG